MFPNEESNVWYLPFLSPKNSPRVSSSSTACRFSRGQCPSVVADTSSCRGYPPRPAGFLAVFMLMTCVCHVKCCCQCGMYGDVSGETFSPAAAAAVVTLWMYPVGIGGCNSPRGDTPCVDLLADASKNYDKSASIHGYRQNILKSLCARFIHFVPYLF